MYTYTYFLILIANQNLQNILKIRYPVKKSEIHRENEANK